MYTVFSLSFFPPSLPPFLSLYKIRENRIDELLETTKRVKLI